MKKNTTRDIPLNDDDLAQVFNAQNVHIPEGIEATIFEQARLKAAQAHTAPTHTAQAHTADDAFPLTRTSWLTHAFAIAATVVLTIIIAPALMREPVDPEETVSAAQVSSFAADDASMAKDEVAESAASPAQMTTSSRELKENEKTLENNAEKPMNAETNKARPAVTVIDSLQSADTHAKSDSAASSTASIPAYRETAEQWINEIKIMIIDGDSEKAREEYTLLEKQFPKDAMNFNPDFEARAIDTESLDESNELQGN